VILDRFRLDDRVAVVTGAGRGLGAAIALGFAEAGADVVISARTAEQLDAVVKEVEARGRRAVAVPADLSDLEQVKALVPAAIDAFGRLDIVVNNVGGSLPMPLMLTTDEMLEEAFHFNVTTALALTRTAVPHLLAQPGSSVLNISSAMGRLRERGYLAYGTAKAALAHMTRLLAADVAPHIRVNALAVGSVLTSALEIVAGVPELKREMEGDTPLRRLGEPEDIAAAALWLCSDAGSFVTGKVIEVDGGIEKPNLTLPLPDLTKDTI
jgi:7-alpha-hydroxysteroid dehydrogenase